MAVYAIAAVLSVSDPEKFSAYQQAAGPMLAQYGGKILGWRYQRRSRRRNLVADRHGGHRVREHGQSQSVVQLPGI